MIRLIIFFILLSWFFAEFQAFEWMIERFGLLGFLFEISFTFFFGFYILVKTPQNLFKDFHEKMYKGQIDERFIFSPLKGLFGALFLILPGLISDIIGLVLSMPTLLAGLSAANNGFNSASSTRRVDAEAQTEVFRNSADRNFKQSWSSDEVQARFDKAAKESSKESLVIDAEIVDFEPEKKP